MNNFWSRHKRLLFILGLFAAPFVPLAFLRFDLPRLHIYDEIEAWFVHPTAEAIGNATGGAGELWSRYISLVNASRENESLHKDVSELRQRILELEEASRENERLKRIVSMPDLVTGKGVAGKIIGQDTSREGFSFVINVGSNQGIAPRMPVVSADGVVGTITKVFRNSSVFVSFLDPNHDMDGLVTRTRARLIVEGRGKNLLARLKYLDRSEDVRVGDLIVTGGVDGVFPKGLPIGSVVKVDKLDAGVTQDAEIRAAVDVGHLEEVVVLRASYTPEVADKVTTVGQNPQ